MEAVKAWGHQFSVDTKSALTRCDISAGHALFGRMMDAGARGLDQAQLTDEARLSEDSCNALVNANVLAKHVDGTFTCSARHVVRTFEALRVAPVALA